LLPLLQGSRLTALYFLLWRIRPRQKVRESETKSPAACLREDQEAGPFLLSLVEVILIDSAKIQEKRELMEYWDLFETRWKNSKMVGAWMQRLRVNFYNHFRLAGSVGTCWSISQMFGVAGMAR
tara:strand:+ start:96 stop:467 length:372 start_codon:yes stop_codon:yes gene_type:complete